MVFSIVVCRLFLRLWTMVYWELPDRLPVCVAGVLDVSSRACGAAGSRRRPGASGVLGCASPCLGALPGVVGGRGVPPAPLSLLSSSSPALCPLLSAPSSPSLCPSGGPGPPSSCGGGGGSGLSLGWRRHRSGGAS